MKAAPRIVAIETSGRAGSAAVALGGQLLEERVLPAGMRHAVELMPVIRELTRSAGWKPHEIEQVYLSLGPGSFTGLRIAVAIARALHQAIGCKLVGVPSLDVIAENAPVEARIVMPILDAKRGQVFAARYERAAARAELVQTIAAGLVNPADFLRAAAGRAAALGGEGVPVTIAVLGEGVDFHREALAIAGSPGVRVAEVDRTEWPGRARTVHRLGWARAGAGLFSDAAGLLPLYIRLPEAEEVYQRKQAGGKP